MSDLMDQRLSEAARRWQSEQAAPPAVPLDRLEERLPRTLRWRPLVAAAAVVVAGASAVLLIQSPGRHAPEGPTTPTAPRTVRVLPHHAGAVPWASIPAGHPTYRHKVAGKVVTPYDHVSASGHISGHLRPGDTLAFTAVLESSTDLPLDPCPDFNVAFGRGSWHTWQLNCSEVRYRDQEGRPVLPAFKNVRFEMRVTVPDQPGLQKVLWTLNGPMQMPGFYGMVHVSAG